MTLEEQVQAVRRRFVQPQVRLLRLGRWRGLDADLVADCALAAGGDAVVAHRLMTRWEQEAGPRTVDMTHEEEVQLVAYIRNAMAQGFECDCGTCGGGTHMSRFMHQPGGRP